MSTNFQDPVDEVWQRVQMLSAEQRRALLARLQIWNSAHQNGGSHDGYQESPADLIGAWKTDDPPTDEEVEQILDEERMRKYG